MKKKHYKSFAILLVMIFIIMDIQPLVVEAATKTYTITYKDGDKRLGTQVKKAGTSITINIKPQKTGYIHKGWSLNKNAATATINPEAKIAENRNMTLYAVWKKIEYTVKFDTNGGINGPSNKTKEYGSVLTIPTVIPKRAGFNFKGWSLNKNATTATINPGAKIAENRNITLYAVWEAIGGTVYYDWDSNTKLYQGLDSTRPFDFENPTININAAIDVCYEEVYYSVDALKLEKIALEAKIQSLSKEKEKYSFEKELFFAAWDIFDASEIDGAISDISNILGKSFRNPYELADFLFNDYTYATRIYKVTKYIFTEALAKKYKIGITVAESMYNYLTEWVFADMKINALKSEVKKLNDEYINKGFGMKVEYYITGSSDIYVKESVWKNTTINTTRQYSVNGVGTITAKGRYSYIADKDCQPNWW